MTVTTSTTKKVVRRKTTTAEASAASLIPTPSAQTLDHLETFNDLIEKITKAREGYEKLQKEIAEAKLAWNKEQQEYQQKLNESNQQQEITRKREQETYDYETARKRKTAEDEFNEKEALWERELVARKDELAKEKAELEDLRKRVIAFDADKEKAIKQATEALYKELESRFAAEKKFTDQQNRSDQELLKLRIENLTVENARQSKEIEILKKALDEATAQVKDIAVKVIESRKPAPPPPPQSIAPFR